MPRFYITFPDFTHADLFQEWLKVKHLKRIDCCRELKAFVTNNTNANINNIQAVLLKFIKNVGPRWTASHYAKNQFMKKKNKIWLDSIVKFRESKNHEQRPLPSKIGRPLKKFEDCGTRAKQKKNSKLNNFCEHGKTMLCHPN